MKWATMMIYARFEDRFSMDRFYSDSKVAVHFDLPWFEREVTITEQRLLHACELRIAAK